MQVDVYEYVTVEMRTSASVIVLYGSILIDIVMYDGETDVQALKPEGNRWLGLKTLSGEPISIPPKRLGLGIRYAIGGTMFGLGWALTGACPGPLFALVGNGVTVMIVAIGSALAGTWLYGLLRLSNMAVRVGFEPTEESPPQRFSRPPDSTTLAPHRILILPGFHHLRTLSPRDFSARWAVSPIWHHFLHSTQPPAFLHRGSCGRSASSRILTNGRAVPSPSLGPHHFW